MEAVQHVFRRDDVVSPGSIKGDGRRGDVSYYDVPHACLP